MAALLNIPTELPGVDRSNPEELAAAQAELVRTMTATSVPRGDLKVPVLATHTLVDVLAPVEYEEYAETTRGAGRSSLLRQAYVDTVGHCAFTVAETLDAAAERHGEGRYVRFRPAELVNDRTWGAAG